MDSKWLEQILTNEGFSVEIMTGRYSTCGSLLKKSAKVFLNSMIRLLGRRGMFLAPHYVVYADAAEQGAALDGDSAALHPRQ